MNRKTITEILKWFAFVTLVLCFNLYVARLAIVYGVSMEPTLQQYDCLLVWQLGYEPAKGDIVVTTGENPLGQSVIKRVAGVQGDTVSYVDLHSGETVELTVPEGKVFLLGDNSANSMDSRELGCFDRRTIRGRVVARIFPFTEITLYE